MRSVVLRDHPVSERRRGKGVPVSAGKKRKGKKGGRKGGCEKNKAASRPMRHERADSYITRRPRGGERPKKPYKGNGLESRRSKQVNVIFDDAGDAGTQGDKILGLQ